MNIIDSIVKILNTCIDDVVVVAAAKRIDVVSVISS